MQEGGEASLTASLKLSSPSQMQANVLDLGWGWTHLYPFHQASISVGPQEARR